MIGEGDNVRDAIVSLNPDLSPMVLRELRCFVQLMERVMSEHKKFETSKEYYFRFDQIPSLYQVGDLVYVRTPFSLHESNFCHSLARIFQIDPPRAAPLALGESYGTGHSTFYAIHCYMLDFDGFCYGATLRTFTMAPFKGYGPIRYEAIYPTRYTHNESQLLQKAQDIGRKFCQCVSTMHMSYSGVALVTNPLGEVICGSDGAPLRTRHIESDVIVDFREALTAEPAFKIRFFELWTGTSPIGFGERLASEDLIITWSNIDRTKEIFSARETLAIPRDVHEKVSSQFCLENRYLRQHLRSATEPSEDDLVLLPQRVFGYSIRDVFFCGLDVRNLSPVATRPNAFDGLQLPEDHKESILAAVKTHLRKRQIEGMIQEAGAQSVYTQDLIPGKGTGVNILLHGEPGVGKTATAEAIAHLTGRPLLRVNCGLLSTEFVDTILHLAHRWDCILLFDEADVFLAARSAAKAWVDNSKVSGTCLQLT